MGDAELVAAARRREEWAWAALVDRYSAVVSAIAWSYHMNSDDSAEIRQVVWLRLFEGIGHLRDGERIAGWIRTVAGNECSRLFALQRREVLGTPEASIECQSDDAAEGLLAHELSEALRRALVRVPGKGRLLLESQLAEPRVTYAELATKHDMPLGSIGPTRQRSLRQLRAAPELAALAWTG